MSKVRIYLLAIAMAIGLAALPHQADADAGHSAVSSHVVTKAKPAAKLDPCFFTESEYLDWQNGDHWGASLSKVENTYANCVGVWDNSTGSLDCGDWYSHNEHCRVWPMKDGSQVEITFAHYDTDPTWRAHDEAWLRQGSTSGNTHHDCEWPRPSGNPCNEF